MVSLCNRELRFSTPLAVCSHYAVLAVCTASFVSSTHPTDFPSTYTLLQCL